MEANFGKCVGGEGVELMGKASWIAIAAKRQAQRVAPVVTPAGERSRAFAGLVARVEQSRRRGVDARTRAAKKARRRGQATARRQDKSAVEAQTPAPAAIVDPDTEALVPVDEAAAKAVTTDQAKQKKPIPTWLAVAAPIGLFAATLPFVMGEDEDFS
jgi:hypothetical protein